MFSDVSKAKKVKLESDTTSDTTVSTKDVKPSRKKQNSRANSLSNPPPSTLNPPPPPVVPQSTINPYIPSSTPITSTTNTDNRGGQLNKAINHVGGGAGAFPEILPGMDDSLDVSNMA